MKIVITVLLIAINLIAGNLEKAKDAINENDYERAFILLQPLADEGNADAQFHLANIYFYEKESQKNINMAFKLYIQAAKQGNVDAQLMLATKYCYADKIEKDLKKCADWANQAKLNGKDVSRMWNHFELDKYLSAPTDAE